MAESQRELRSNETAKRTSESAGKTDVARSHQTEHELQRRDAPDRGEVVRRGGRDFGSDPFAVMRALRREMDRVFDDFGFGSSLLRAPRLFSELDRSLDDMTRGVWAPQVEVWERDGKLHVSADLPGLDRNDVRIEMLDNQLTIEGERRSEQRDERGGWSERTYGRFFRSIPLPEGVDSDTASAKFDNGVLEITFDAPKREARRGRQIPIADPGRKNK